MLQSLAGVSAGVGSVTFVSGEPGVGKTALVNEFARQARERGALVTRGAGFEGEWTPPFGPWIEALRGLVGLVDRDQLARSLGSWTAPLVQLLPELILDVSPDDAPGYDRLVLYQAVAELLRTAGAAGPIVLMLDDLHWADRDTLSLLGYVARTLAQLPVLLVCVYRHLEPDQSGELRDTVASIERLGVAQRLPVLPFAAQEAAAFLRQVAGVALSQRQVDWLHRETSGNPLFLTELARNGLEEGWIHPGAGRSAETEFQVPAGVRQVILRRVGRLGAEAGALLRAAAVFPAGFTFPVMTGMLDMPEDVMLDALEEALRAGLLRTIDPQDERYDFVHDLVRQSLLEEASVSRRRLLNRRAAETIEQLHPAEVERRLPELAHHWAQADPQNDRTLAYLARAGERALRLLASYDATFYFDRAIAVLDAREQASGALSAQDALMRFRLLLSQGDAHWQSTTRPAARTAWLRAAAIARTLDADSAGAANGQLLAEAALRLPVALVGPLGPDPEVAAVLAEALEAVGPADSAVRARLLARSAHEIMYVPTQEYFERRISLSEEAIAVARRIGDQRALAYALEADHHARWGPGNPEERNRVGTELLRIAQDLGDRELLLSAWSWRAATLLELGDRAGSEAAMAELTALAESLRHPMYLYYAATWRGMMALIDGRYADVEPLGFALLHQGMEVGDPFAAWYAMVQFLLVYWETELATPGLVVADQALAHLPPHFTTSALKALRMLDDGRAEEARQEIIQYPAEYIYEARNLNSWLASASFVVEVLSRLELRDQANALLAYLAEFTGRVAVLGYGTFCLGSFDHYLGLLATAAERYAEAEQYFERALRMNEQLRSAPFVGYSQLALATMLVQRGRPDDSERARGLALAAYATAGRLSMPRLLRRSGALLAQLGEDIETGAQENFPDGLTGRQVEVLRRIAAGQTNREIADALAVSEATVQRHISNIYNKIGARGRVDATVYAVAHGLIEPGEAER